MKWNEIRQQYPNQWLVIEAYEAETSSKLEREINQIGVVEQCPDGSAAFDRYRELHNQYPQREFYFVHTSREELDIKERTWIGVRRGYAVNS